MSSKAPASLPLPAAVLVLAAVLAASPTTAQAPPPDYSGTWSLHVTATLPDTSVCPYKAVAEVQQDGAALDGTLTLTLIDPAPAVCPGQAMGVIAADVTGDGCLASGVCDGGAMFGTASFDGCPTGPQGELTGAFSVETGPFAGTTGSWTVPLRQPGVPALSSAGLAAVAGLILLAGVGILRNR